MRENLEIPFIPKLSFLVEDLICEPNFLQIICTIFNERIVPELHFGDMNPVVQDAKILSC
jgi:hypothetical protein